MHSFAYRVRASRAPLSVADYRRRARQALPAMVWSYLEGGAEDEVTLGANRLAFSRWRLRQRVLTGTAEVDLATTVAGTRVAAPILLAPTGLTGLVHWTGEPAAARAAEAFGTRAIISTAASYTPEEVAAATRASHFFQLYPWQRPGSGHRSFAQSLLDRVEEAGFTTLVVTVDTPTYGNRERERRHGMGLPPVLTPGRIFDAARRPRWWLPMLRHRRVGLRILEDDDTFAAVMRSANLHRQLLRPDLRWSDLEWLRGRWSGQLFVKGILDATDAATAVSLGADGVVVSNHGGRQLDGLPASLDALPPIVDRIGDHAEILLDGGIRRGSDIVKAICLGARAVLVGRPFLYGLAAAGQTGVEAVLRILSAEMERTMILMGAERVAVLDRSWVLPAPSLRFVER
jgi:isopentenyl diphosphate isomerase/L-lactate dehydrogenase-like FMN-dependent dehydrogenase